MLDGQDLKVNLTTDVLRIQSRAKNIVQAHLVVRLGDTMQTVTFHFKFTPLYFLGESGYYCVHYENACGASSSGFPVQLKTTDPLEGETSCSSG